MRMLPELMRNKILPKHENLANPPKLLRQRVLHHSKLLTSWQETRGAKPAHVL